MVQIKRYKELTTTELDRLFNRFGEDFSSIMINTVVPIVQDVRDNREEAVIKYTHKFDGVKLDSVYVTEEEIERAHKNTSKELLAAFMEARRNIEEFHRRQLRDNSIYSREDGTILGMTYQAIESAGIYVPGGKASYPSSVLMGVIPAQIAGTKNITVITPPDKNGNIPDVTLAILRSLDLQRLKNLEGRKVLPWLLLVHLIAKIRNYCRTWEYLCNSSKDISVQHGNNSDRFHGRSKRGFNI
jgi:histidinol dehydrogenase